MPDYGLVGGLGAGLQSFMQAYQASKQHQEDQTYKQRLADRMDTQDKLAQQREDRSTQEGLLNRQLKEKEFDLSKEKFGAEKQKLMAEIRKLNAEADKARGKGKLGENALQGASTSSSSIDQALAMTKNPWSSGAVVGQTKRIPGTPASNLETVLDTIRANVAFDKLQAMRNSSPTGGALGQVSEKELKLLQDSAGKVDASMPTALLQENLKKLSNQYMDIIHGPGRGPQRYEILYDKLGNPISNDQLESKPAQGFLQGYGEGLTGGGLTDQQANTAKRWDTLTSGDRGGFLDDFNRNPNEPNDEVQSLKDEFENREGLLKESNPGSYVAGNVAGVANDLAATPVGGGSSALKAGGKGLLKTAELAKLPYSGAKGLIKTLLSAGIKDAGEEVVKDAAKVSSKKAVGKLGKRIDPFKIARRKVTE